MGKEFEDKTAFVTGAGAGIGEACALALAEEGAAVAVVDTDRTGGEDTVSQITSKGGRALYVACDVADETAVQTAVKKTVETFGSLDCAVNSAGITGSNAPFADFDSAQFDRVISVNLRGIFLCMKYQITQMIRQGRGAVVNIASGAGLIGVPTAAGYTASKHGVVGLTKVAALDHALAGIRVNAVCPGIVRTPMTAAAIEKNPVHEKFYVQMHPIGRIAESSEIADAVLWLCSSRSSYVTGTAIPVDGGYVAK